MTYIPNPLIIPIGLIAGILIAAPVGPVNVLCIQRAIERGFWGGIAASIGSVMGDGLIALCAGLSVGTLSGAVQTHRAIIQLCGGVALIVFGLRLYFSPPRLKMSGGSRSHGSSQGLCLGHSADILFDDHQSRRRARIDCRFRRHQYVRRSSFDDRCAANGRCDRRRQHAVVDYAVEPDRTLSPSDRYAQIARRQSDRGLSARDLSEPC